jgi:DnaJ-class molecular chaperone
MALVEDFGSISGSKAADASGALLKNPGTTSILREACRLDSRTPKMIEQTKDCGACAGTGNDMRVRSPYPIRKILFQPCPACAGTGQRAESPAPAPEKE